MQIEKSITESDESGFEKSQVVSLIIREKPEKGYPDSPLFAGVTQASEDPIGPLFERSWFHRMWTVQEVTHSSLYRVDLYCGSTTIPWPQLLSAVDALRQEKYSWGRWEQAMRLISQLSINLIYQKYPEVRDRLDSWSKPLAFFTLMNTREKLSTDPKDKIFALHGMFKEIQVPFPSPDYRKTVEDVYREAVVASINYDRGLEVLYHVPSDHRRDGLVSWVPDWSDAGWKESDPRYGIRNRFAACGPGNPNWRFSTDQSQLIVTGKIVDSIIYRAKSIGGPAEILTAGFGRNLNRPAPFSQGLFTKSAIPVLKTWVEVSQWSEYPTGESTKEALRRTLVMDDPNSLAQFTMARAFDPWYNEMMSDEPKFIGMDLEKALSDHPRPTLPTQEEDALRECAENLLEILNMFPLRDPSACMFNYDAVSFSQKKCLFYTQSGYFGTAPDPLPTPVEPGDKIAVIGGLGMPLLLRPVEGGYRLLTHVYVHGIMYGEAWPENVESLEEIVLV
jgi:hypothetical protein